MMEPVELIAGADVGGSKSRVVIATASGTTLASATGPGAAMRPGEAEHCAAILVAVVAAALADAGHAGHTPAVLCAGFAGVGREPERVALHDALARAGVAQETIVETDAAVVLADAFGTGAGILLVAGTGSIAFGRSPAGATARVGGWGPMLGDEGSGTWIARRALSAVTAAHDGREPETALTGALLTAAQVNDVDELVPWAAAADRDAVAALAPSVLATAAQGDGRASAIVDMAVEELVLHVVALARQLFVDERASLDVALAGGLLGRGSLLRKRLERRLRVATPGATIAAGEVDGARGAAAVAARALRAPR